MTNSEIRDALLDAISESKELRTTIMGVPEKVEKTVEHFTPVLTGETVKSITTTHRKVAYKRLTTRRVKIGEVYSDDDPKRVNAIEYGRHDGDHGETPEFAMFRKAAAVWDEAEL